MGRLNNRAPRFVCAVCVLLFVGFIATLLCNKWHCSIKFTSEVSPVEIVNIFITAIIAIWLGMHVTKKLSEQRFLKEFIIADIYKIEESLDALERLTITDRLDIGTIFQAVQILRMKIEILEKTSNIFDMGNPDIKNLSILHTEIYTAATDVDGEDVDIALKRDEIQELCSKFILLLRKIVHHINKQP
jgi:hypothetical protein